MRSKLFAAALAGATTLALGLTALPAEAAKKKSYQRNAAGYSYSAGPRTRIYVSRRSWLDSGTQVLPGERKFNDYAQPVTNFSRYPLDSNGSFNRRPLSGPFDVP